jgi:hypothetical protein
VTKLAPATTHRFAEHLPHPLTLFPLHTHPPAPPHTHPNPHRCVTALKDVSAQLGPIGAAIQTKLASTSEEALREVLSQQKALAVGLYDKLTAFLGFEQDIRGPLKKCLRELASLAGGWAECRISNWGVGKHNPGQARRGQASSVCGCVCEVCRTSGPALLTR